MAKVALQSKDYPDLDQLRSRIAAVNPRLSLATVYNTLRIVRLDPQRACLQAAERPQQQLLVRVAIAARSLSMPEVLCAPARKIA